MFCGGMDTLQEHSHRNHLILSILCSLLIPGLPLIQDVVRFLLEEHGGCDYYAVFVVKSLYGHQLAVPTRQEHEVIRPFLILSTLGINIFIAIYNRCSRRNAVVPVNNINNRQAHG